MTNADILIKTLGAFTVKYDQRVVKPLLTSKTSILLAYLALNPQMHTRSMLASLFWAETSNMQALKNLRTVLSSLRKNIPDAVNINRQAIQINKTVSVDALQFDHEYRVIIDGDLPSLNDMLKLADLYTGDFLSDLPIYKAPDLETWASYQREQLRHKYEQLLYKIVERCLASDNLHPGIDIARKLVMIKPLWEAAHRQLMLLLVRLGQRSEALIQYHRLVDLLNTEVGISPDSQTVELYDRIKSERLSPPRLHLATQIVLPDVVYIPPAQDLALVHKILEKPDCRLLTITGIGGVGKSMLATFVAHNLQKKYPDGAIIVSLSDVQKNSDLPGKVFSSMNVSIKDAKKTPGIDQVIAELRTRSTLLVLDNYEQLSSDTELIRRIIIEAPGVQILVTSRVALTLAQEWVVPLKGLSVGQPESESIQLFCKIAERNQPYFDRIKHIQDIELICELLDGFPMGLVVAAAQTRYLSPSQILANLLARPLSLKISYSDIPERYHSFDQLLQSILPQLSEDEQRALQSLSIFRTSFRYEAAIAIADMDLNTFISLVDKSLIQRVENFRYRMHGLLRHLFSRPLGKNERKNTIQRMTNYYIQWCDQLYQNGSAYKSDFAIIQEEHENIWHLDLLGAFEKMHYLLEIIPALRRYWYDRGYAKRVTELLLKAVYDEQYPADLRARGMVEIASLLVGMGEQEGVKSLCRGAINMAPGNLYIQVYGRQQLAQLHMQRAEYESAMSNLLEVQTFEIEKYPEHDPFLQCLFAGNYTALGLVNLDIGMMDVARSYFNIAINRWQTLNEPVFQTHAYNNLAIIDMREGQYEKAQQHLETIIPVVQAAGYESTLATYRGNLGKVQMLLGDYTQAHRTLIQVVRIASQHRWKAKFLYHMETLAELAYHTNQYIIAIQLYSYLLKRSKDDEIPFREVTLEKIDDHLTNMNVTVGKRYLRLFEEGTKLSQNAAVVLAESLYNFVSSANLRENIRQDNPLQI